MAKYLKKTDWGDYWVSSNLAEDELISRAQALAVQLGIRLDKVGPRLHRKGASVRLPEEVRSPSEPDPGRNSFPQE